MRIKVTPKGALPRTYPDNEGVLENLCMVAAGGGSTQAQTIKAMIFANTVRKDGKVKTRTVTIELVQDADTSSSEE